jgi:hypothetical protein
MWWGVFLFQCLIGTLVYMISFVATLYAHPNSSERIDVLETVQHMSIIMLMVGGFVLVCPLDAPPPMGNTRRGKG